jgi:hypothetical protein
MSLPDSMRSAGQLCGPNIKHFDLVKRHRAHDTRYSSVSGISRGLAAGIPVPGTRLPESPESCLPGSDYYHRLRSLRVLDSVTRELTDCHMAPIEHKVHAEATDGPRVWRSWGTYDAQQIDIGLWLPATFMPLAMIHRHTVPGGPSSRFDSACPGPCSSKPRFFSSLECGEARCRADIHRAVGSLP